MPVKRAAKSPSRKPVQDEPEAHMESPFMENAASIMEQDEQDSDDDIIFPDLTNRSIIVRLNRIDDNTGKYSPHGKLPLMEARYSKIAELFGGGRYKAQAYEPDATGSPKIRGTRTWVIPGVYRPPMHLPGENIGVPATASNPVTGGAMPRGDMTASETLNTALVSQVIELMKATREAPKENPLLAMILPKAIEVLGDLMMKKKEPDEGITALLASQAEELRQLRAQLTAKPEAPVKSLKDTIEDVISIRQLLEGGGEKAPDGEQMMWAAGLKALEALSGAKPTPPPAAVNPQQAVIADPNTPIWKKVLRGQKQKLLMAAGFGLDPYFAADTAIKTMPQQFHGAVIEFLQKPDHVELAMQELPELRNYEHWATEFFGSAFDIMLGEPEGEGDGEDAAASGDPEPAG